MDIEAQLRALEERVQVLEAAHKGNVLGRPDQTVVASSVQIRDAVGELVALLGPTPLGTALILGGATQGHVAILNAGKESANLLMGTEQNQSMMSLGVHEGKQVQLSMHGETGHPTATLNVVKNMPGLSLKDKDGHTRLRLNLLENGVSSIHFQDPQGRARATFMEDGSGGVSLMFNDAAEKVRATLSLTRDGTPVLMFAGEDGKMRVTLAVEPDMIGARLYDHAGNLRLAIGCAEGGHPKIALMNDEKNARIVLAATDDNSGLQLFDSHQAGRLNLSINADEQPWFYIKDGAGAVRFKLTMAPDGKPVLCLCDEQGRPLTTLAGDARASGLVIHDPNGKAMATLCLHGDKPQVILLDDQGEPVFNAP